MMVLAAIHELRNFNGPRTFSLETTPSCERLAEQGLDARPNLLTHCLNHGMEKSAAKIG